MADAAHTAIVGNGAVSAATAAVVDRCGRVIRFNFCGSYPATGGRTDVLAVCNTGRPARAMLSGDGWRRLEPVEAARAIWCLRDPATFAALRPVIEAAHPELDDFCDDGTEGFRAFAADTGKDFAVIAAAVHETADRWLAEADAGDYVVPSSGLVAIAAVLAETDPPGAGEGGVLVAGFDHAGWPGHPFDAERRVVDRLAALGRIERI